MLPTLLHSARKALEATSRQHCDLRSFLLSYFKPFYRPLGLRFASVSRKKSSLARSAVRPVMSSLPPPTSTKIRHDTTRNSTRAIQEDGESCHQSQSLHVPQHQTPQRGSSARPAPAPAASSRRRVAFRPTVSYREIPSRTTLTSYDIGELWFTSHDFDLNKAESRATVKKMRKLLRRHAAAGGNIPNQTLLTSFDDDDDDTTIRGLEHLQSRSVLVESTSGH